MAENAKGAGLYRIKIHFDDGRPLVELLAEEFDIDLEEKDPESGLRKYSCTMPTDNAHGPNYYTRMVDLYQKVMTSLRGEAEWVTGRELSGEKARITRERELGRSLPAAVPGAHKAWPMTPEGVVFFKDTGTVAVVGLELSRVSNKRLAAYETILESYSMDPAIDRAYLFFAHENAMQRVKELSRCYRQDGFFVFREYKAGDHVELAG